MWGSRRRCWGKVRWCTARKSPRHADGSLGEGRSPPPHGGSRTLCTSYRRSGVARHHRGAEEEEEEEEQRNGGGTGGTWMEEGCGGWSKTPETLKK